MVGHSVDKFKARDSLVAAHDAHIFAVFAVGDADSIGRTLRQGLFFACAAEIVEPDGS